MTRADLLKRLGWVVGLLALGLACGALLFQGTLFPAQAVRIKTGIQQTLDRLAAAYNEKRPQLLQEVLDPANPYFKGVAEATFDNQLASFWGAEMTYRLTVTSFEEKDYGYVLANVRVNGEWAVFWYFREADGRWWLSEPTRQELGAPQTIETEHFRLVYYPWSADILPLITNTLEAAYTQAVAVLVVTPTVKAEVEVVPLSEMVALQYHSYIGVYLPDETRQPPTGKILVVSPHTYIAPPYYLTHGWKPELTRLLAHEYTHLLHHQAFARQGWTMDWLVEGLAQYVANDTGWLTTTCAAVREDFTLPIWDRTANANGEDLLHLSTLQHDKDLAYGLAHWLVIYVVETYGGLEAVWQLAAAYDQTERLDVAVPEALGVRYQEFDQGWQAWLAQQC